MIIGDGIMLGAGGETASIVVTAPAGSTVTCTTPGGVVLDEAEISGTWTFANLKVYGAYTIMASNGSKAQSKIVLVDSANVFSVEIDYKLWLYKDGDECTDVTGGWGITGYSRDTANYPNGLIAATKNADNMFIGANAQYCLTAIGTLNTVDLTNYSNLCITRLSDNLSQPWIGACQNKNFNQYNVRSSPQVANKEETTIIDISEITGNHYIVFVNSADTTSFSGYVYKIWLE